MTPTPVTQAWVFSQLPDGTMLRAGEITLSAVAGSFRYSNTWLENPDSYPLDPVNLPFSEQRFLCRNRNRLFPVFSDAGPDDWGTRVLLRGHTRLPANELERLLACSGQGVGSLRFSLSRTRPKTPPALPDVALLDKLEKATLNLAGEKELAPAELDLLLPASSMGGARPKVTVTDKASGKAWLIKFGLPQDIWDMPVVEYATLSLASQCGIVIPEIRLQQVADRQVLLVDRFDRKGDTSTAHFISAHSLFNRDKHKIRSDAFKDPCSYPALAGILRRHAAEPAADCRQLFLRLLFNVLINNTDDHGRNHALLYNLQKRHWQLSPAYDLLPIASGEGQQALGVGRAGRESSLRNVLSAAPAFGLDESTARTMMQETQECVQTWEAAFRQCGVTPNTLALLKKIIPPR